jgi:chromosomal replication initiation ATPase DnaA
MTAAPKNDRAAHAVIREIARANGFSLGDILSRDRRARLCKVRREIAKLLRFELGLSLPRIGALLRRNHASVLMMTDETKRSVHNAAAKRRWAKLVVKE